MTKTLVIIPTKDRLLPLNCLIQNLIEQEGEFDVFIADMNTDPGAMLNDWYTVKALDRLKHRGHNFAVFRIAGNNQLYGYQAGLEHALSCGYDLCFGGDDDLIYDPGFLKSGIKTMTERPDIGILVGMTLLPWMTIEEQTIGGPNVPIELANDPDFSGKIEHIERGGYYHCTFINPLSDRFKQFEMVYGGFFFRPEDAKKVGGFPTYMSSSGFRGETIVQKAIERTGKKQILDRSIISWHYSNPYGGLRMSPEIKAKNIIADKLIWNTFIARGTADTSNPLVKQ